MKKKFLLYASGVMCLSASAIQISNAMQSDNYDKTVRVSFLTAGNYKIQVSFQFDHGFDPDRLLPPVKYKIENPTNGSMQYFVMEQKQLGSIKCWDFTLLTEDVYNQTDALLAEVTKIEEPIIN